MTTNDNCHDIIMVVTKNEKPAMKTNKRVDLLEQNVACDTRRLVKCSKWKTILKTFYGRTTVHTRIKLNPSWQAALTTHSAATVSGPLNVFSQNGRHIWRIQVYIYCRVYSIAIAFQSRAGCGGIHCKNSRLTSR